MPALGRPVQPRCRSGRHDLRTREGILMRYHKAQSRQNAAPDARRAMATGTAASPADRAAGRTALPPSPRGATMAPHRPSAPGRASPAPCPRACPRCAGSTVIGPQGPGPGRTRHREIGRAVTTTQRLTRAEVAAAVRWSLRRRSATRRHRVPVAGSIRAVPRVPAVGPIFRLVISPARPGRPKCCAHPLNRACGRSRERVAVAVL